MLLKQNKFNTIKICLKTVQKGGQYFANNRTSCNTEISK